MINNKQIAITEREAISDSKCGCVLDDMNGAFLAYANVFSLDSSIVVSTNEEGIFSLPSNLDEDLKLIISYIGFEKFEIAYKDLTDCDDIELMPKINLQSAAFKMPYLVIKDYITDGIDLDENGQSTKIKPRFLGALPGQASPDIMKTIQFLPGIGSPSSKASDIYIRGGTPDQNLILWEDIPIYHPAHYFGMISAVDPFVVSEMNIYRSGFDASYGGRIAGVIDMKSYGLKDRNTFLGVGSDLINYFINGHQKFGSNKNTAITFSFRKSFANAWESPTFKNISQFNQQGFIFGRNELTSINDNISIKNQFDFTDTHLKLSQRFGSKTTLQVSALFADNYFVDEITDDRMGEFQRDTMELKNMGASLSLLHQWNQKFSTTFKAVATNYEYKYNLATKEFEENQPYLEVKKSNRIVERQLQLNSNYQLAKSRILQFGYHFTDYDTQFNNRSKSTRSKDFDNNGDTKSILQSAFINFKNPIRNVLGIDAGLRVNYYDKSNKLFFEPRIKLSYQLNEIFSLHANYGKHHQFISQLTEFKGNENGISTSLWALAEARNIPIQNATQWQIGFVLDKNSWLIDLQAYQKDIKGLSSRAYNFDNVDPGDASVGDAAAKGIDILIKKRFSKNIKTWLSYTLSDIELGFPVISNRSFSADYNQRHALKIASQIKLGSFEFSTGLHFASGTPFTKIAEFTATNLPGDPWEFDIDYAPINTNYLDEVMELNLSASYQFHFGNNKSKGFITASVINLLNKENIYSRSYYVDAPKDQLPDIYRLDKLNLPTTPNINLRFEF